MGNVNLLCSGICLVRRPRPTYNGDIKSTYINNHYNINSIANITTLVWPSSACNCSWINILILACNRICLSRQHWDKRIKGRLTMAHNSEFYGVIRYFWGRIWSADSTVASVTIRITLINTARSIATSKLYQRGEYRINNKFEISN
jgi:hypothetical protein